MDRLVRRVQPAQSECVGTKVYLARTDLRVPRDRPAQRVNSTQLSRRFSGVPKMAVLMTT